VVDPVLRPAVAQRVRVEPDELRLPDGERASEGLAEELVPEMLLERALREQVELRDVEAHLGVDLLVRVEVDAERMGMLPEAARAAVVLDDVVEDLAARGAALQERGVVVVLDV